jgi:hypothetical protein
VSQNCRFGTIVHDGADAFRELGERATPRSAFKRIRILFRCWKERKPYDEAIYQCAFDARRPKKELAAQAVELP